MLENITRLILAVEGTGRKVLSLKVTHPNGEDFAAHYHITFNAATRSVRNTATYYDYGTNRIWGRDVDKLLAQIAAFEPYTPRG